MIEFPTDESQTYHFTIRTTDYSVYSRDGNFDVAVSDGSQFVDVDDTDICYWIGVVYAYKMTDDTTRNVYDCQDYRIMGAVCQMLNQIPEFEDLEYIIGYRASISGSEYAEYADWSTRAKQWLERQRRRGIPAFPNSLAEGAD